MIHSNGARDASTVVLARPDESGGLEILLTRRPRQMKFLGGFYVFPGGAVHEQDYSEVVLSRCRGLLPSDARQILGNRLDPERSLGHWVAGVRELFEEVGVLVCEKEPGESLDLNEEAKERLEEKRKAVVGESLDFGSFLVAEGLYCDLSRLVYYYHRVTPEIYPIRFDTSFYLAQLPPNQIALTRSEEVTDAVWIAPGEALERGYQDLPLIPPTTTVLESLAAIPSWKELQARYDLRS
jgi:8-oxo-dGTP pyrophosphatase MutT (NUDIX family)